jgi:hypothetical protein
MKFTRAIKTAGLLGALILIVAACDSGEGAELTTTSSSIVGSTTIPGSDSTTSGEGQGTTSTLAGEAVASHEVVLRESTDDGETLYIVIPPGDYTDVDLENFVGNLMENDESVTNLEVFDDGEAIDIFLLEESEQTAADLVLISEHHLVTLTNRNRIIYRGPYADLGEIAIGS